MLASMQFREMTLDELNQLETEENYVPLKPFVATSNKKDNDYVTPSKQFIFKEINLIFVLHQIATNNILLGEEARLTE